MENMDKATKVEDMDEMMMDTKKYTIPLSYYLPPQYSPNDKRVSPWYQVSYVGYPIAYPGLVSQVGLQQFYETSAPAERILPSEPQDGEDERAALVV